MFKKALISGEFNGKEYVGDVIEISFGEFRGSIHQVPTKGQAEVFDVYVSKCFPTKKEAEDFVKSEWEKEFKTCK